MIIFNSCIRSLTLICLTCLFVTTSQAEDYPIKSIRFLVPASTGTGNDMIGRLMAAELASIFRQQVIVDNRAGAAQIAGTTLAAKAPADGYTLLQITSALIGSINLQPDLPFNLTRDFEPVTQLASSPQVLVIYPPLPVKSIKELVALAKAKPSAISYASAGHGTSTHVAAMLFFKQAGVDVLHVPYNSGGPAITGVMSGETSMYFAPLAAVVPQIQQGKMRAIAVTTTKRSPLLPEVPTVAESGYPRYAYGNWYGLLVPAKTPKQIIATIHRAVLSALNGPNLSKRLNDLSYIIVGDKPEEFAAHIKSELARMAEIFPPSASAK